jgi:hypothetical protein
LSDLSITAANVVPCAGNNVNNQFTASVAITQGETVYLVAGSPSQWALAKSSGTATLAQCQGVALNSASAGQPLTVQTSGPITIGATVVVGGLYILSATAGLICPFADIATTNFVTLLGVASSATVIQLAPNPTGVAHA